MYLAHACTKASLDIDVTFGLVEMLWIALGYGAQVIVFLKLVDDFAADQLLDSIFDGNHANGFTIVIDDD